MLQKMANVLVVGSGMTGAATAAFLRQALPENTNISIWDKARGAGGRMSTSRSPEDPLNTVDLGAQYITLTKDYQDKRKGLYNELQSHGILTPMQGQIEGQNNFDEPGAEHFVTPKGVSSLVKYFLEKGNASIMKESLVTDVSFQIGGKVSVTARTKATKLTEDFDICVITMPVPQILQLSGTINESITNNSEVHENLKNVSYSSRYAMGLFFSPETRVNYPWAVKYVSGDPCVRFISVDQAKRGVYSEGSGWSAAVHTSVPFGLANLESEMSSVQEQMLQHVKSVLPDLPDPIAIKPQKWRYSQVHHPYKNTPGCVCISTNPLIILAGDAFAKKSTFDGCLDSAESVAKIIKWTIPPSAL